MSLNQNKNFEKDDHLEKSASLLKDVVSGNEGNLKEKIASGEVDDLISHLDAYSKHPATQKSLTNLLERVDQSAPIRHFRNWWNNRDHLTQWALMHSTKGPNILSSTGPIQTLIKFGFVDYKGHLDENGEIMEQKIQAMGGWDKFLLKYGIKFGKYFFPELSPVEPFVDPLLKLQNIADDTLATSRKALRLSRQIRNTPEENISEVTTRARSDIDTMAILQDKNISLN